MKKIIAIILLLSVLTATFYSCDVVENLIYNDKPLPEYDYPDKVYTYNHFSAVAFEENDNEQQIRALIDMINDCKFKKVEMEIKELGIPHYFEVDKNKVLDDIYCDGDFAIYNEGKYLMIPKDNEPMVSPTTLIVYEVKGFDMSIAMPFLEKIYME